MEVFTIPADPSQAAAQPTDGQQNIVSYKTERRATATVTVTTTIQHHSESPRPCDSIQKPEVSVNVDDK